MAVQTTYKDQFDAGSPGQIVNAETNNIISRAFEAELLFGAVAVQGAADRSVKASAADATDFIGFVVRNMGGTAMPANAVAADSVGSILTTGVIYVTVSVSVTVGDAAYFVPATGAITNVSTGNIQIPNSRFDTTTAANDVAILRFG